MKKLCDEIRSRQAVLSVSGSKYVQLKACIDLGAEYGCEVVVILRSIMPPDLPAIEVADMVGKSRIPVVSVSSIAGKRPGHAAGQRKAVRVY